MTGWNSRRPAHAIRSFVESLAGGRPARPLPELVRWLGPRVGPAGVVCVNHVSVELGREPSLYAFGGDPHPLVQLATEPAPCRSTCFRVLGLIESRGSSGSTTA